MPTTHVDFGQPSSIQGAAHFPVAFALPMLLSEPCSIRNAERIIAEHSHAPPIFYSPAVLPLRI
jgi:hypothetical protein